MAYIMMAYTVVAYISDGLLVTAHIVMGYISDGVY